jgi:hypothetical protein
MRKVCANLHLLGENTLFNLRSEADDKTGVVPVLLAQPV